jgi:hypothetical protein
MPISSERIDFAVSVNYHPFDAPPSLGGIGAMDVDRGCPMAKLQSHHAVVPAPPKS